MAAGRGRGLSLVENHGAVGGQVAEVTIQANGAVKVDKIYAATDAYHVVNPNLVDAQIEGGAIFAMAAMMYGEITVKNGAVVQGNFNDYRMLRLPDAPDVVTALALTGTQVGEFQGVAPTGKRMIADGTETFKFESGIIAEKLRLISSAPLGRPVVPLV